MTQDDFEKFEDLLSGVGEIYGKTLSEFALTLWWGALKDYDLTAIRNALSRYVVNPDNGQFMPKPADVVRMIGGTSTDSAMIAWTKVDKAVRQVGTWQDVVFDDPLIHRIIGEMGGWIEFGKKTEDEWPFVAKEFETRYRGYASRGITPEYKGVLTGIANANNSRHGFNCGKPVLIGDPEKARRVIQMGGDTPQMITRAGDKVRALLGAA